MDGIAAFVVLVLFFFIGVGVQYKNPKFGQGVFEVWKKFGDKFKNRFKK